MLNKLLDEFDGKLNTSKWAKITKTSQDTIEKQILVKEPGDGVVRRMCYSAKLPGTPYTTFRG